MYPTLLDFGTFEIGGFHLRLAVHSYGTFLGLAILTVALILSRELERKKVGLHKARKRPQYSKS